MKISNGIILIVFGLLVCFVTNAAPETRPPESKSKQTILGQYATAKEAYERWRANPQGIKVLDVRNLAEYVYVGHAPMAYNIPYKIMSGEWDRESQGYASMTNPDFVAEVRKKFGAQDTIFIMCRSGGRSAAAVNALAEAGFKSAYTVIDGFEGDTVEDSTSYFHGKRVRNGWKNSGAPWTYDLDPDLVYKKESR
ncbi:MAG TPA: rhodanese-like domain-containing protein [archaeon]|nr:rhodanese-like domain-containing protein [archaeon]